VRRSGRGDTAQTSTSLNFMDPRTTEHPADCTPSSCEAWQNEPLGEPFAAPTTPQDFQFGRVEPAAIRTRPPFGADARLPFFRDGGTRDGPRLDALVAGEGSGLEEGTAG